MGARQVGAVVLASLGNTVALLLGLLLGMHAGAGEAQRKHGGKGGSGNLTL